MSQEPAAMPERDYSEAALRASPRGLAALLRSGAEGARLWGPEELAAVFGHQLSAPVLVDLGGFDRGEAGRWRGLTEAEGPPLRTFAEVFQHPAPPRDLLVLTKEFAKANMNQPESALPPEIAAVVYYLSIAAAAVRRGEMISGLAPDRLREGLNWASGREWIDAPSQALLKAALAWLPPAPAAPTVP